MIAKTITFENLDGEDVTQTFYFHIPRLEAAEILEVKHGENLVEKMRRLEKTSDGPAAYEILKDLVLTSYGRKAADNIEFEKKDPVTGRPLRDWFEQTDACGKLIFELFTNEKAAAEFFEGVLPARLLAELQAEMAKNPQPAQDGEATPAPVPAPVAPPEEKKEPTDAELLEMSPRDMTREQMNRAFALKTGGTTQE